MAGEEVGQHGVEHRLGGVARGREAKVPCSWPRPQLSSSSVLPLSVSAELSPRTRRSFYASVQVPAA